MRNLLFALVLSFPVNTLLAQWSADPSENTRVTNGGLLPEIISDGTGGAYIVYQDSPALLRQIWVQWLDRFGYVRFPESGIRVCSPDRSQTPYYYLVSDSAGGVIVVFEDFQEIERETVGAVYAQRIDSTGVKLWGEAGVEVSPLADNKGPVSACSDGAHGVFVFWGEDADSSGVPELWGQRVNSTGELLWPDNGVVITEEFASFNVAINNPAVSDDSGGAFILYADSTGARLQRIDQEGELVWEDGVNPGVGGSMISDKFGGVVISGVRSVTSSQFNVLTQRINANGQVLWDSEGVIITEKADDQTQNIELSIDDYGNSIFVWRDRRTGQFDVYTQRVNIEGVPLWKRDGIPVSTFDSEYGASHRPFA